jgi:hypothetical protein
MRKTVFHMPLDGIIAPDDVDRFIKDMAIKEGLTTPELAQAEVSEN